MIERQLAAAIVGPVEPVREERPARAPAHGSGPETARQRQLRRSEKALLVMATLAVIAAIRVGRPLLLPLVLALFVSLVLRPLVHGLQRLRIPPGIGAGLVLAMFLGLIGFGLVTIQQPAMDWIGRAPASVGAARQQMDKLLGPFRRVRDAAVQVQKLTAISPSAAANPEARPDVMGALLSNVRAALAGALVVFVLAYLLLASEEVLVRQVAELASWSTRSSDVNKLVTSAQTQMTRYLVTASLINVAVGISVGLATWALGVPNALLWGVMAGVLNYVPYAGAATGITILLFVSLLTFGQPSAALAPPAAYLVIATIEGQFITPIVIGNRFSVPPVTVFAWMVFWGWMWGLSGILLAVPLLTLVKIYVTRVKPEGPIARLLEARA